MNSAATKLLLTCFGFIMLTGCSAQINGFSMMNGGPTQTTLQAASAKRESHLTLLQKTIVKATLTSALLQPLNVGTKEAADKVLCSLKNLDSVTEMGVNYVDYPNYVREVRFEINRFSSKYSDQKDWIKAFELCLAPYVKAQYYFGKLIHTRKGSMGHHEFQFYLTDSWKTGQASIKMLENNLHEG